MKTTPVRKYLWRIMLTTTLAVLFIVVVLSTTMYVSTQNILLKKEYESNRKVFDQVTINIDMMDTMASNLCKYLYISPDVESVMYARGNNPEDEAIRINRIVSAATSANPYIHSVTIYNPYSRRFMNAGQPLFYDDRELMAMTQRGILADKLRPVSRKISRVVNQTNIQENVLSYFMYEVRPSGEVDGAIVVNMKTDWFMDNIKKINAVSKEQGSFAFVLDNQNEWVETGDQNADLLGWLKGAFGDHRKGHPGDNGYFEARFGREDYLVSYARLNNMDMSLLKIQRMDIINQSIRHLRTTVIEITLVVWALAVLIFIRVSLGIYRPVGKLVQLVSDDAAATAGGSGAHADEIHYLSSFFMDSKKRLEDYEHVRYQQSSIVRAYWLNRILSDGELLEPEKTREMIREGALSLNPEGAYALCVLRIDNQKQFTTAHSPQDQDLLRFAVINIVSEVLGRAFKNEGLDTEDGDLVFFLSLTGDTREDLPEASRLLAEAGNHVKEYFRITFSAVVSPVVPALSGISGIYPETRESLGLRLKLGHQCIITPDLLNQEDTSFSPDLLAEAEKQLAECYRKGQPEEVRQQMQRIMTLFGTMHHARIPMALFTFAGDLKLLTEQNRGRRENRNVDFYAVCRELMETETLESAGQMLCELLLVSMHTEPAGAFRSKNSFIVEAVQELVRKMYPDHALSLTLISEKMNIPSRRLSKLFHEEMGMFIPDYINDIRLQKAAELLETTSLTIGEISARIGIDNESYFYKVFKSKFGMTPKEYAIRRISHMSREKE